MNFTGGNTVPTIGRRINWQLMTLLGGLAVAISAGALAGAFDRDRPEPSAVVSRTATNPTDFTVPGSNVRDAGANEFVYVIVGSNEEAASLQFAISSYAAALPELAESVAHSHIVSLETPEQEAQFNNALVLSTSELMAQDVNVHVVDLRDAPANNDQSAAQVTPGAAAERPIVYIVSSQEQADALSSDTEITTLAAEGHDVSRRRVSFLVIDSPELEALLPTAFGEQMAAGTYDLVDLR